jgi:succinate dehydrogenase/fumarate reductase cytochrome b subunit
MTLFQHGNSGVVVMFFFNFVHILQLLVFENILAYKNVTSYISFSIAYGFE